jgi:hypothetical protein
VEQEELGVSLARMVLGQMAAGVRVMVVQVAIGAGVQVARVARVARVAKVAKVAALVPRTMVIPIPIAIVAPMAEVAVVEMVMEEVEEVVVVEVVVEVEEVEEDGVEEDGVEVVEGVEHERKIDAVSGGKKMSQTRGTIQEKFGLQEIGIFCCSTQKINFSIDSLPTKLGKKLEIDKAEIYGKCS